MTVVNDYTAILSDTSWAGAGVTGRPAFVTFSFDTIPQDYLGAAGFAQDFIDSFVTFSEFDKDLARNALQQWADASGLYFIEVAAGHGDMRFGNFNFDLRPDYEGFSGFAYYPWTDITDDYAFRDAVSGDVFINTQDIDSLGLLLHEIGHAIGFKHPFDDDPTLPPELDNAEHTVMSYTGYSEVLGTFDVQAVAHVYGGPAADGSHVVSWSWNSATETLTQTAGGGDDSIFGVWVADVINGGGGNDHLAGFQGNDTVSGEGGADFLYGGDGNDRLADGDGDDKVQGEAGNDTLVGGLGNDEFYGDYEPGSAASIDTADYSAITAAVVVDLQFGGFDGGIFYHASGAGIGLDYFWSVENVVGGSGADELSGDDYANALTGGGGNDTLGGRGGGDTLSGGTGSDTLEGGDGADSLIGGTSVDAASYQGAAVGVTASLASPGTNTNEAAGDTYSSIEDLLGSNFADNLTGNGSDNFLRGGLGGDTLNGGAGFDWADYLEASAGVTLNLATGGTGGEATGDTYTLIEAVVGSTLADSITGNGSDNFLRGALGADTLNGGAGFDWADYLGATAGVTLNLITGGTGGEATGDTYALIEAVRGSALGDNLTGNGGENYLRGGLGADTLNGGAGYDWADYFGAAAGVTLNMTTGGTGGEATGDTYTLIEAVRGSSLGDNLTGTAGDNFLRGGLGGDTLNGAAGYDWADYFEATAGVTLNLITGGTGGEANGDTYTLIEAVRGSALGDNLTGNGGDNFLQGRLGADTLNGGAGYDWADYRDAAAGVTLNLVTGGTGGEANGDTYTLIEAVRGSTLGDNLTGTGGDNYLRGGGGADTLDGGAGFDWADYLDAPAGVTVNLGTGGTGGEANGDTYTLIEAVRGSTIADNLTGSSGNNALNGHAGNDTLTGGAGNDDFIFDSGLNASTNVDTITDFSVPNDTIRLENAIFTALATPGTLAAGRFVIGTGALDGDDNIIYNSATGGLFYDADGSGVGAQVRFATLTTGLALTNADFFVV